MERRDGPRIWAVAAGKGGVGKSIVATSLAISLSRERQHCVILDADLGGANLHTLLGVEPPRRSLAHFLRGDVSALADVVSPTSLVNLSMISGHEALVSMANPKYHLKQKLLRHVRRLDADHVVLDIGAGVSFNVLDLFLAADRRLLVVVPEPTSVENAYAFLKAAFFRALRPATRDEAVRSALEDLLDARRQGRLRSPRDLVEAAGRRDPRAEAILADHVEAFTPTLIVNQASTVAHRHLGWEMATACRRHLGARLAYAGALDRDECVRAAVSECTPVLERFPGSAFASDFSLVFEELKRGPRRPRRPHVYGSRPPFGQPHLATHGLRPRDVPVAPPAAAPPELPPLDLTHPGDYLRRVREGRRLALPLLRRRTRILCLEAIEAEAFDRLPPEPFLRGLVTNYARELGIDEASMLAASFIDRYRETTLPG